MNIAIDLSPLQNAHRMRGIGFTLINFLNNLPEELKSSHFIFYLLPPEEALFPEPFELINVTNLSHETRLLRSSKRLQLPFRGRLNLPFVVINKIIIWRDFYLGYNRTSNLKGVDLLLQADQNQLLPLSRRVKKILIIYDLIPYVLESDYLWTFKTARRRGRSRKGATLSLLKRGLYRYKINRNVKRANKLLAISEHTKKDFIKYLSVSPKKISVIHLGVMDASEQTAEVPRLEQYITTSWGFVKKPLSLNADIPYLLFVGGADNRRKLEDLVAAFNILRAQSIKLKLVLAGDIMLGPDAITTTATKRALKQSSYLEDIIFMGFITDHEREWLYKHALAFVFPSRYEGFGLPVLEAMANECPVISYRNEATVEVAGSIPIYADNLSGLVKSIKNLLTTSQSDRQKMTDKGLRQVKNFSWSKTAKEIAANF